MTHFHGMWRSLDFRAKTNRRGGRVQPAYFEADALLDFIPLEEAESKDLIETCKYTGVLEVIEP